MKDKAIPVPALMYSSFYGQPVSHFDGEDDAVKESWETIHALAIKLFLGTHPSLIDLSEFSDLEWHMDVEPERIRLGDVVVEQFTDNGVTRIRKGVAHHLMNDVWVTEEGDPITIGNTDDDNEVTYHIGRDPNRLPQRVGSTIIASMYGNKYTDVDLIRLWSDSSKPTWFSFNTTLDGKTLHTDDAIDSYVESQTAPKSA